MRKVTLAALCAGLVSLPLALRAQTVLYDRGGQPVAVLVPVREALAPVGTVADLFAQQDAIMDRMMADMRRLDAVPAMPDPARAIEAAFGGMPGASSVVFSSFSAGSGSCSRTVTYQDRGGAAPVVKVSQTGDACGALPQPGSATIPAALPDASSPGRERAAPAPQMVPQPNGGPRLIRVDYRHPVRPSASHRG